MKPDCLAETSVPASGYNFALAMKASEIITAVVALYGAVLSTVALAKQLASDRISVTLKVKPGMQISGDPRYSEMTLIILEVINRGRRPVTIIGCGAVCLYPTNNFITVDNEPPLPCELTEGKYITAILDQADTDASTVDYWEARDSSGRMYRLRQASWFKHWKSSLQRTLSRRSAG